MATKPNTLFELFTATPQISEVEQARHYIGNHRAARDDQDKGSHKWHVEQIKLDWWVSQLLRAVDCTADVASVGRA